MRIDIEGESFSFFQLLLFDLVYKMDRYFGFSFFQLLLFLALLTAAGVTF